VSEGTIDFDLLSRSLQDKLEQSDLTIREAATEIGCSAATLSRMLKGADAPNTPDATTLFKVASWLGKRIADFEARPSEQTSTLTDVEIHLRALPGLAAADTEALVAMVRAAHDAVLELRKKKG